MVEFLILILNFIYFFSFLVTTTLTTILVHNLFLFFSYEDNIYFSSDDHLDIKIDRLDYVYEELFEYDINQYEFYEDETFDADLDKINSHLNSVHKANNNVDNFHGYFNSRLTPIFQYLELLYTTKLFLNNEGLILFIMVFVYSTVNYLTLVVIFFLTFYLLLFFQYNNFFNFKKFINLNSTLKSEKGFLNYTLTELETTNKSVDLTDFVGSTDHYILTNQSKDSLINYSNYYPPNYSKKDLTLLLNNNLELNVNYLVNFISTSKNTNLTLNNYLLNFLLYSAITTEWKKRVENSPLLKFENSDELNKVEFQYNRSTTNDFTAFVTSTLTKQLQFEPYNFLIVNAKPKLNVTLKQKNNLNFVKSNYYLVDSSLELLKYDYSAFYNCLSDENFDDFYNLFQSFLNLDNVSYYLPKFEPNLVRTTRSTFLGNFLKNNYSFKNKFYDLYYYNLTFWTQSSSYLNDYFNFFSIVNLTTNSTPELTLTKKVNIIMLEHLISFNVTKKQLSTIWADLCTNLNLVNLTKLNFSYKAELKQIFNFPHHNKFYLKLLTNPLKLKIYNFLFKYKVQTPFLLNFNNSTLNFNLVIKKNKFLKNLFKKFFKFDFLLKLKRKKSNKKLFSKRKFFYYFWVNVVAELKKLPTTNVKKIAFDYLLTNRQFLNFFKLSANFTKLNILLAVFLSPTVDCFYVALTDKNCNFYYNSILNNPFYQKLKLNFLNFNSWVNFFNSVNVTKVAEFLKLPQNKLLNVNNLTLSTLTTQSAVTFLDYLNFNSTNFSKLFFLKNLYKKLFFENNYFKFNEINQLNDYFFYIKRIFLLIFKFEFRSTLNFINYHNLFNTKLSYNFKKTKKINLIKSFLLQSNSNFAQFPKNDYTLTLLNLLLSDNNFIFNNFYNSILNYQIFNDNNFAILDKQINVKLLTYLGIKLNLSTSTVKLNYLAEKLSLLNFITVLNYVSGPTVQQLNSLTFYYDNILNPNSVTYNSFVWVDNEEDPLSYIPEDGILLEDNSMDNEFDEEGYAEIGLIDFSLELNADLLEDNFKKSLTKDYGYVTFFPYKIKKFTERFLFFNYFKEIVTFKNSKIYLSYYPNWGYLIFSFFKVSVVVICRNFYYLFSYKLFFLLILLTILIL